VNEKNGERANPDGEPEVRQILATTRDRVAEILETTDRAVAEILETANTEAEKVVAEAHEQATRAVNAKMERISNLIEGVLAKAGTLDSEFEQMRELVDNTVDSLADDLGILKPASAPADAVAAQAEPARAPSADGQGTDDRAEAIKLLAIQMIATGHSVERASERLRAEFNVDDPAAVLAEIGAPVDQG
jgi:serine phosphatase RsbU (regulator of sigma subunit)